VAALIEQRDDIKPVDKVAQFMLLWYHQFMNRNALLSSAGFALIVAFLSIIIATPAGNITLIMLGLISLTGLAIMIPVTMEHRRRMKIYASRAQGN
jgi:ABC-type spermidine/putrescine transport system permease subunit II